MKHLNLFLAALIALCFMGCKKQAQEQKIETLIVETETVGENATNISKNYVGEVEAESSTVASFTGMGTVTRMNISEGQHVKAGQVIAQMDDAQNRNALTAAQSILSQAQDAYDRMKKLHDAQSLSDMDWVNVESKLQQAKTSVEMAKKSIEDCTLKAPCSGIVGSKMMEVGQTALPAQPICEILNINRVKVKVSIPEQEISKVTPACTQGEGVKISIAALDGQTFYSHSFTKGVQGDAMTHTYDVLFNLDNPGCGILPGMVAQVELPAMNELNESSTTLPIRSIQQSADGKHFVWVNQGGKAHRVNVTTGSTIGNRIEVLSGIQNGDKVIVAGYQKVSEGSNVKN